MKQLFILFLFSSVGIGALAQTKSKSTMPVKKAAPAPGSTNPVILKTLADSASYAIGQNLAQSISKDLKSLNKEVFVNAIKAVFEGQTPKFTEEQMQSVLTAFSQQEQESQARATIDEGRSFLEKNKSNPNIKTTATGLQYEVIKEGNGIRPTAVDTVICHYRGMLIDSSEFDNSYNRGEPITIAVDGGVIPGWTEGLQLMTPGSKYRFYIPYELGYGLHGAPPTIPGGSTLIFDIELLEVKKGQ